MDRDPTVGQGNAKSRADRPSLARRLFKGNGQIITAVALLAIFGGGALWVALNTETAMARILEQRGSEGFRQITIEFEHDGELYTVTDGFDVEGVEEGDVVRVWFDGNDPAFVEFSTFGLFLGFYIVAGALLIWLAIAIVRRARRREKGSRADRIRGIAAGYDMSPGDPDLSDRS